MKTIFATVDFSKASNNGVLYAAELSRFFSAKLFLFHAYHYVPIVDPTSGFVLPEMDTQTEMKEKMKKYAEELKTKFADIEIIPEVKLGFAAELIEKEAKKKKADVIVMGITGKNGLIKKHLIGSVTTSVAKTSAVPVLIVPQRTKFHDIKNIAFACDMDKRSITSKATDKIKYFCSIFKAGLKIFNVIKPGEEISAERIKLFDRIENKLEMSDPKIFFIHDKKVEAGILKYIKRYCADMIIMCPKKHTFFDSLFKGSHTEKLAFNTSVPILTVHA